jgi:hypothetical protein
MLCVVVLLLVSSRIFSSFFTLRVSEKIEGNMDCIDYFYVLCFICFKDTFSQLVVLSFNFYQCWQSVGTVRLSEHCPTEIFVYV